MLRKWRTLIRNLRGYTKKLLHSLVITSSSKTTSSPNQYVCCSGNPNYILEWAMEMPVLWCGCSQSPKWTLRLRQAKSSSTGFGGHVNPVENMIELETIAHIIGLFKHTTPWIHYISKLWLYIDTDVYVTWCSSYVEIRRIRALPIRMFHRAGLRDTGI